MKKVLFFLFFPLLVSAQKYEYSIITNVVQRGQLGNNTCWAASLEMLASAYKKPGEINDLQLKYIRQKTGTPKEKGCSTYQTCPEKIIKKVNVLPIDSVFKELIDDYNSFKLFASDTFLNLNKKNKYLAKIDKSSSLNWIEIKRNFRGDNPSPMLLWREFGNASDNTYHITIAIGYFEVKIGNNNSSKFILVNDPWVKKLDSVGTHYLVNYDQFMQTSDDERSKIFMYGFENRNNTNLKIKLSKDTLGNLESFSYSKKFLQRKKIAGKKLAETNVLSILNGDFLDEKEISRFLGSKIKPDLVSEKSIKVSRIKEAQYKDFSDFQKKLRSSEDQEFFTLTTTSTDTCFVYVTAKQKNVAKYTAVSQRIEPYETSVTKVLSHIQEEMNDDLTKNKIPVATNNSRQNNFTSSFTQNSVLGLNISEAYNPKQYLNFEFDNVYLFKTFNSKPDFLLIPKQTNQPTSFILVDLFDKMKDEFLEQRIKELPIIPGFEVPFNLEHFKYKLYAINNKESYDILLKLIKPN